MKLNIVRMVMCAVLCLFCGLGSPKQADAALFGLWKSKKKPGYVARQSLVIFPFDQGNVTRVPARFGEYVASDLRNILSESDRYSVVLYRDRLAPIARALSDQSLRPPDTTPPFSEEKAKPLKLAQLLAADLYLVGSIDDFQVDAVKKVALITLSAQLVDAKTGKLLKTLLVTGRTPETVVTVDEDELRDVAKGDAVTKLGAELLVEKRPAGAAESAESPGSATAAADKNQPESPKGETAQPVVK